MTVVPSATPVPLSDLIDERKACKGVMLDSSDPAAMFYGSDSNSCAMTVPANGIHIPVHSLDAIWVKGNASAALRILVLR